MKSIISLYLNLQDAIWKYRLRRKYNSKYDSSSSQLRLVLGVARSGTTWIANTLAQTKTAIRYFEEPLYYIKPRLRFSTGGDHTAVNFDNLCFSNRLLEAYKVLTNEKINLNNFIYDKLFKRNDKNYKYVLVKEVHSLLGAEFLAKNLNCKILFILRDIVTIVDSIFNAQTLKTPYLKNEYKYLRNSNFINFYFKDKKNAIHTKIDEINSLGDYRKKTILSEALVMLLIQHFFKLIVQKYQNCTLVNYEDIVINPDEAFLNISNYFSFDYEKGAFDFSSKKDVYYGNPYYSISRNTKDLLSRKNKFLSDNEVEEIKEMISSLGLD